MKDALNMLLPGGTAIAAGTKAAKKLPKKSKKDRKIPSIARQTKADSTENVSSKMKATARSATPPADKMKSLGKLPSKDDIRYGDDESPFDHNKMGYKKAGGYMKKMGGGYMKKMKKGGKTGKYNCSHNRLY